VRHGPARDWEVVGDETGRRWRYHLRADRLEANGERFCAVEDDGSLALIHRCEKDGYWDDEVERMRSAIALARLPEIRACQTIRQLLDINETDTHLVGEWKVNGYLTEIWEWASTPLHELPSDPGPGHRPVVEEVAANVSAALAVIHGLGFIHCDVAPNNIFFVDGVWKLGDLDSCVARGDLVNRGPTNQRYLHPDRRDGPTVAKDDFDTWGLERVLERLREKGW
jgi:serine/threonine protein kinase